MSPAASPMSILVLANAPPTLDVAMAELGARHETVSTAAQALAVLWGRGADVVVLAAHPTRRAGELLARLRERAEPERPRVVLLANTRTVDADVAAGPIDAVVVDGAPARAYATALAAHEEAGAPGDDQRALIGSGTIGGPTDHDHSQLKELVADAFGADRCVFMLPQVDEEHDGADAESADTPWSAMRKHLSLAAASAAPVLAAAIGDRGRGPTAATTSYLAASMDTGGTGPTGLLGVVAEQPRTFTTPDAAMLAALAKRIGGELRWEAAHQRVVAELDALRAAPRLDPHLSLWNRAALERLTGNALAACERRGLLLAAIVFDIQDMKHINMRHGLAGGDAVIAHVATAVLSAVRAEDLVGRFGGDEIAVIASDLDAAQAVALTERVQQAIAARPVQLPGGECLEVAVTAGVATSAATAEQADRLLTRVVQAARAARGKGEPMRIVDTLPGEADRPSSATLSRTGVEGQLTLGGSYRLLHEISRGGMGVVYRAEDIRLGRPVAIKMLRPDLARDAALVNRFQGEAEILAQLEHPNLVRIFSFGSHGDDTYFAMELVEGESLQGAIERCRREHRLMPLAGLRGVIEQMGSALDALHQRGIVHRDVKPANVLIDPFRGRAVLVDVGIARRHGDIALPAGTPGFVPPEVLAGDDASAVSDVYALAATMYAAMTLELPFGEPDNIRDLITRQTVRPPPPPSHYRAELAPLDAVILPALSCDPNARPSSAGKLADALSATLGELTAHARARRDSQVQRRGAGAFNLPMRPAALGGDAARPTSESAPPPIGGPTIPAQPPPGAGALPRPFGVGRTRAVVLRAATSVLGVRATERWRRALLQSNPALAEAISAGTAPLEWVNTAHFRELLAAAPTLDRQPTKFARDLGRATVRLSFRRLFPVAAATLVPSQTLAALDVIWSRYHDWGALRAVPIGGRRLLVRFGGSPAHPAVCAFVEGMLEQLVTMSGGTVAGLEHAECMATGAEICTFRVAWSVPSAA